jgi:hypothetical protein
MEASEKPQLPLDSTAPEGTVRALDDRLVIEDLTVTDERAAQLVRDRQEAGQEPARTVANAIEIGARVLDREDISAEADYVRAEFERYLGQLADGLEGRLEEGSEALAEQLAATFGIDRSDSVQQQLREMLIKANEHQRTEMVRLFNAEDGTNPLSDFKTAVVRALQQSEERRLAESQENREQIDELTRELVALRERQLGDERVAEAEEAGTRKGRSFEERVHDALSGMADSRGDAAFHVGAEPGKGGSKKGDTVIEVDAANGPAAGKIVFEAKDRQLSKNKAWQELNEAMSEREAEFAVLVVAGDEHVPAGREQLHEYEGNKLIVAVDPEEPAELGLDLAYRYARCRLIMQREGELQMDAPAVRDAAGEALSALKQAQSIKLNLKKASDGVADARTGLETMAADVKERLERIETLVAAAAEDAED